MAMVMTLPLVSGAMLRNGREDIRFGQGTSVAVDIFNSLKSVEMICVCVVARSSKTSISKCSA